MEDLELRVLVEELEQLIQRNVIQNAGDEMELNLDLQETPMQGSQWQRSVDDCAAAMGPLRNAGRGHLKPPELDCCLWPGLHL